MPAEREEPEIELTRVYDDKYTEYEKETRVHVRLKNVKKRAKNLAAAKRTSIFAATIFCITHRE